MKALLYPHKAKTGAQAVAPPVVLLILLLTQFALRVIQIDSLAPFIDEGFHARRADVVWDLEQNPARTAHGKLLLYFWLGLFESDPPHNLYMYRFASALFSLLTGAALVAAGKQLHSLGLGLVGLAVYAVLPFAVFFDRMALADPFASGWVALVAWRSLVYAKLLRTAAPARLWREGVIIGVLLGLATLAKLTVGLIPLLPGLTALLWWAWDWSIPTTLITQGRRFLRLALPPMLLAAAVVMLMWSPFVVPAYFARHSDSPYNLVDGTNHRIADEGNAMSPLEYARRVGPAIQTFIGAQFWQGGLLMLAVFMALALFYRDGQALRGALFLILWSVLIAGLLLGVAQLIRSRYFVPLAPAFSLGVAYGVVYSWQHFHRVVGVGFAAGLLLWVATFALPTNYDLIRDPHGFPFDYENWIDYKAGYFLSDAAVAQAVQQAELLAQPDERFYAPWNMCHLAYFQTDRPIHCLSLETPVSDIRHYLTQDLDPDQNAYIIFADYSEPFFQRIEGLGSQQVARYERTTIRRPVSVWRVWWITLP